MSSGKIEKEDQDFKGDSNSYIFFVLSLLYAGSVS